ncbi:MAG: hypothetical protein PHN39_00850 [Candidatus Pacebacteria bacterium]|nr:hypothetical protein [Candidatus Paceibacterota bacterium]
MKNILLICLLILFVFTLSVEFSVSAGDPWWYWSLRVIFAAGPKGGSLDDWLLLNQKPVVNNQSGDREARFPSFSLQKYLV